MDETLVTMGSGSEVRAVIDVQQDAAQESLISDLARPVVMEAAVAQVLRRRALAAALAEADREFGPLTDEDRESARAQWDG